MKTRIYEDLGRECQNKLEWLADMSRDPGGGVSRLLYSAEWVETQQALKTLFNQEGLKTYFDEIGNLFGRLEGKNTNDETILTGSHIDTVKNGGMYDGQFGIVAGFMAIKYLQENFGRPYRNIEVVSLAEEEGSRFPFTFWGSKNIAGTVNAAEVNELKDAKGNVFGDVIKQAGFDYKPIDKTRDDLKAFIEVHVEQGNILETEKVPVGIVQHITGQRRFTISVKGQANHAGTTPMGYRKDAMNIAARMITAINDLAVAYGDPMVATIGSIALEPNTVNVVPGKATFTIDVRHTQKEILVQFTDDLRARLNAIAEQFGAELEIDMYMDADPVAMDPGIVRVIRNTCDKNKMNYKMMHSGAGHDSQIMAQAMPTAMIFVPSRNGISHSPDEFTDVKDLAEGVKALIGTLYELGYQK
ncbi:allantoate deiminase [Lentibacillus sp. L22]|uniref:allantoate deiminase n=1 Tax=Lentibacillus TaxID=175304 RepID=UPI0022B114FF|nr:allantoate deiminase [Lentibacillus daqui]